MVELWVLAIDLPIFMARYPRHSVGLKMKRSLTGVLGSAAGPLHWGAGPGLRRRQPRRSDISRNVLGLAAQVAHRALNYYPTRALGLARRARQARVAIDWSRAELASGIPGLPLHRTCSL